MVSMAIRTALGSLGKLISHYFDRQAPNGPQLVAIKALSEPLEQVQHDSTALLRVYDHQGAYYSSYAAEYMADSGSMNDFSSF